MSTFAKITEIYKQTSFFDTYALSFFRLHFSRKQTPGGHAGGLAKGGGITKIGF